MSGADAEEIDAYVKQYKTLRGYLPEWCSCTRRAWQARWGIANHGGTENSELCLTVSRDWQHQSVVCLHRQRIIYRIDIAPQNECKPNFHTAWKMDLPAEVCGPHVHGWPENREYVIATGFGSLPLRRPIQGLCETLSDAIGWVGQDLNIHIAPDQRAFEMPPRALV